MDNELHGWLRLPMFNEKPFDAVTKADLDALISGATPEGRLLDYKEQLIGNSDGDKKEFLADVTSFANAGGGDLVFGVRELRDSSGKTTGIPQDAPGITGLNADGEIRRLEAIITSGVAPRIPGVRLKTLDGFPNGPVLILRVPRSWGGPHMITLQQWSRFYSRNNAGKYPLDVQELRAAFGLTAALPERIRQFRDERLSRIIGGEAPVPLRSEQWVAFHIVPVESLVLGASLDVGVVYRTPTLLRPMGARGWSHRFNLDGVCTWDGGEDRKAAGAYTQLFRTGMLEAVATGLVDTRDPLGRFVRVESFEQYALASLREYLDTLDRLGATAPAVVLASLMGTKHAKLMVPERLFAPDVNRIDRDMLILPEVWLEDLHADLAVALRPLFDALWQAAGWARSLCYDEAGKRRTLR